MTKVLPCNCTHAYQDEKYGRGLRLHNRATKETDLWRCTVCGKERKG